MSAVELIFDAPNPKVSRPFSDLFWDYLPRTQSLDIAVGYVSSESLSYLRKVLDEFHEIKLKLICGMQGQEGMTSEQLHHAIALDEYLSSTNRGGVFVPNKLSYHGKIYLFREDNKTSCYVGSANLSSILQGGSKTFESGLFLEDAPSAVEEHLKRDLYPSLVSIRDADIPTIKRGVSQQRPLTSQARGLFAMRD